MSTNESGIGGLLLLLTVVVSILSGILAWNWVEPKSFGGALVFLAAWGLFSYIGHLILGGILYALFDN